jgi:hypothetical protein
MMIKRSLMLGFAAAVLASCTTTTYVSVPDPLPVIGAQFVGTQSECIDVQDGATADGSPIVVFQCHGSPNERWFIKSGVIAENFGSCLDIQGGAPINGAPIILVTCSGTVSQHWSLIGGQIVGLTGKCIAESGGSSSNLTPLILADCNLAPGSHWVVR